MSKAERQTDIFDNVIYSYSRAQAIAEGVLVDVTQIAKEAGFKWPVAVTSAAWEDCVAWTDADSRRQTHQDQAGRLWDVVWMALVAAAKQPGHSALTAYPKSPDSPVRTFQMFRVPRDGKSNRARPVILKMVVGPDDHGNPCLTIVQPMED
jgi:hypothetical protein